MRFPEFSGEWTQCTIGSYGNIITGSTPSTSDTENYDNGKYLWASPSDLGEFKYVEQTQTRLTDKGFGKTRRFPANSIMVTCIGSTIGKMGMSKVEMSTNQQINTIVPTGHDANFVFYTIQSRFPRYLSSIAVQAVPIISKSAFEKLENYTTSIDEEIKIGTFLSLLDERIATQNKIIEDLKKLKSAISANLFMNNDWEQYPIGDLCNSLPVKPYICPSVSGDGAYPIIQQGDNPIVGYTKSKPFKTYNDVVLFGDHTLSIYRPNAPFLLFTDGLKILERKALVTRDFLYYLLCFYRPKSEGYKRHYSILKDIYVPVPTIKKQKQISTGLLNVDIKIAIAEKIEKFYQKQKQYLLAQMFI